MARRAFRIEVNTLLSIFREIARKNPRVRLRHFTQEESRSIKDILALAEMDIREHGEGWELLMEPRYYWDEDDKGVFISSYGPQPRMIFREVN